MASQCIEKKREITKKLEEKIEAGLERYAVYGGEWYVYAVYGGERYMYAIYGGERYAVYGGRAV